MKGKLRLLFKPTFVRYVVSYLVLLAVLLCCVVIYMYSFYRRSNYNSTVQTETNRLASIRDQTENRFKVLLNITNQLSLTPSLSPFRFSEEPAKAYQLLKQLLPYTATTDFCDQMYLIFNQDTYLYASSYSVDLELFADTLMTYEYVTPAELKTLFRSTKITCIPCQGVKSELLDGNTTRVVTYIVPLGLDCENLDGDMIFMMRESSFHEILEDEIGGDRNRYILYNGAVLVSSESFPADPAILSPGGGTPQGSYAAPVSVNGEECLLITLKETNSSFSYAALLPLREIYSVAVNGWLGFLAILFAFVLPCIGLVLLLARNNYRRIHELRSFFPENDEDDLQVIRTGINDLVGENLDLSSQLHKSLPARRSIFVQSLINGRFAARADAVAAAEALNLKIDRLYYTVLLLGVPSGSSQNVYPEMLASHAPRDVSFLATDLLPHSQILLIAFADETRLLHETAEMLCALAEIRSAHIAVAASDIHDKISDMPAAYLEANSAYENRFVMGEGRVLYFKDISVDARNVIPQSHNYTEAIKQALISADIDRMNARLDDLLLFLRHTDMSLFAFRLIYNDVIAAILSQSDVLLSGNTDAIRLYDIFTLSGCRSIDDLDGILRSFCARIIGNMDKSGGAQRPLVQKILAYMTENYSDQEFSLSMVAAKCGLTTTRLSLEFKESMHMSPSEYLTMLRMEHSKRLLRQSEMSIKDICAQVGYYDVSSFIRKFRQYANTTPMQFRQDAKKGGRDA